MNNIKCLPLSYTVFRVFTVLSLFSENTKEYGAWGSIVVKTALLVERSRDRFPAVSLGIFYHGSHRQNIVLWGRLSLWKWVTGISTGLKAAGAYGWQSNTLVVPNVKKIWGLNLPGTPWATAACCRMTFTFSFTKEYIVGYGYAMFNLFFQNFHW